VNQSYVPTDRVAGMINCSNITFDAELISHTSDNLRASEVVVQGAQGTDGSKLSDTGGKGTAFSRMTPGMLRKWDATPRNEPLRIKRKLVARPGAVEELRKKYNQNLIPT
jgi:hypothetical protein